jgi:hypothetical protein
MVQDAHVVGGKPLVRDVEGDVLPGRRIDAHRRGHRGISLLPRLYPRRRMQVQGGLQTLGMHFSQKLFRARKQLLVPRIAGPSQFFSRLVHLALGLELLVAEVPVHVNDQHVERRIVLAEAAHQFVELLVAIVPVARPPCAEGEARRKRDAADDMHEVSESLVVILSVAKEVPVLPLASGPLHGPRPRAFLAFLETEIRRIEEGARRVVHQRPASTRDQSRFDGLAGITAACTVQGARGAEQILRVGETRMPNHRLAVHNERDGEIVRRKAIIGTWRGDRIISKRQCAGLDRQMLARTQFLIFALELGHRQPPVDKDERCVVLKLAVRRPLHADHLWCQHSKPRLAQGYYSFRISYRIGAGLSPRGMGNRRCGRRLSGVRHFPGPGACHGRCQHRHPQRASRYDSDSASVLQEYTHDLLPARTTKRSLPPVKGRQPTTVANS